MRVLHLETCSFARALSEFLLQPRPQFWLARLYLSASVLVTVAIAWFAPFSAQRMALDEIGDGGWILLCFVTVGATIGLLDSVINDVLPERWHLHWADKRRHQVYMGLALLLWAIVFLYTMHHVATTLVLRYVVDGTACALVAIFDTVARYRQVQREALR